MQEPSRPHGALDRFVLERLGEMLRGRYHLPTTLPSRVYDLLAKLDPGGSDEQDLVSVPKESRYRRQAVEAMRAAQHASSSGREDQTGEPR